MECVKITSGFYKGCSGSVVSYTPGDKNYGARYSVQSDDCRGTQFVSDFDENELEGCKK
jgi:hypothetical protein